MPKPLSEISVQYSINELFGKEKTGSTREEFDLSYPDFLKDYTYSISKCVPETKYYIDLELNLDDEFRRNGFKVESMNLYNTYLVVIVDINMYLSISRFDLKTDVSDFGGSCFCLYDEKKNLIEFYAAHTVKQVKEKIEEIVRSKKVK